MTVMTLDVIQKQPTALRGLVCKYLAQPRWQDTCDFYNQMMERERLTVCFHAQLKQRHSVTVSYTHLTLPTKRIV